LLAKFLNLNEFHQKDAIHSRLIIDDKRKLPDVPVSFFVLDDNLIPEGIRTPGNAPIFVIPVGIPIYTKVRMKVSE
jgi:hypothetical protein